MFASAKLESRSNARRVVSNPCPIEHAQNHPYKNPGSNVTKEKFFVSGKKDGEQNGERSESPGYTEKRSPRRAVKANYFSDEKRKGGF